MKQIARKTIEIAAVTAALYRELTLSALRLVPGRN
jgi:hypothetical protein